MKERKQNTKVSIYYCTKCKTVATIRGIQTRAFGEEYIDGIGSTKIKVEAELAGDETVWCVNCSEEFLVYKMNYVVLSRDDFKKLNKEFKEQLQVGIALAQFVAICAERKIKTSPSIAQLTTQLLKEEV